MKTLIVYFSRTGENSVGGEMEYISKGFTEIVAEKIQKITGYFVLGAGKFIEEAANQVAAVY